MNVLLKTLIAAAVSATLLAAPAGADVGPGNRLDPAIARALQDHDRAVPRLDPAIAAALRDAHDRAAPLGSRLNDQRLDPAIAAALRDAHDRAAPVGSRLRDQRLDPAIANAIRDSHDRSLVTAVSHEAAPLASGGGWFHWGNAGVGAGIALGLVLLTISGFVLARRKRGQLTGA
jgi:hypothetical protein